MKIASGISVCANIATIAIAVCAVFGIQQTAKSPYSSPGSFSIGSPMARSSAFLVDQRE